MTNAISSFSASYLSIQETTLNVDFGSTQGTGSVGNTGNLSSLLAPTGDAASISGPGQLFSQLQQLQSTNSTSFQAVLSDIASKLQTAASQSTGGLQQFLSELSNKFQAASSTGDISSLQPHHHHHHHAQSISNYNQQGQAVATSATNSSNGVDLQQLFQSIESDVSQALGTSST